MVVTVSLIHLLPLVGAEVVQTGVLVTQEGQVAVVDATQVLLLKPMELLGKVLLVEQQAGQPALVLVAVAVLLKSDIMVELIVMQQDLVQHLVAAMEQLH
jgi:hypothetical protein